MDIYIIESLMMLELHSRIIKPKEIKSRFEIIIEHYWLMYTKYERQTKYYEIERRTFLGKRTQLEDDGEDNCVYLSYCYQFRTARYVLPHLSSHVSFNISLAMVLKVK